MLIMFYNRQSPRIFQANSDGVSPWFEEIFSVGISDNFFMVPIVYIPAFYKQFDNKVTKSIIQSVDNSVHRANSMI